MGDDRKPTPGLSDMPRAVAQRYFQGRADEWKEKVRELPTAEVLRLAADLLDAGLALLARVVTQFAMLRMEASPSTDPPAPTEGPSEGGSGG